jgi:predicted DNA binding protein
MVFIAGKFDADEILCQVPPHTLRIDLQARRWKSDNDPESAITDSNDNGIPIEFILLGFTPYFGNLGMRSHEEFIRISYIGVTPSHRLLPPRCVCTSIISGKSSQKNFISYFQTLYNNRINVGEVVTSTKFAQRSFNERDPITGADGAKINYNVLEFKDRPAQSDEEKQLIEDVSVWLESQGDLVASALRSCIPGSNLVELPLGQDHAAIKEAFIEANPKRLEGDSPKGLAALPADAGTPGKKPKQDPPSAKKDEGEKELTDEQKAALKAAGLEF